MKITFFVITIVLGSSLFIGGDGLPSNEPKFINLESDYSEVAKSEKVFSFENPDPLLEHDMYLLKNADDLPLMYYADIQTPVCIDNLCKPVFIEMYWDLMGNYVGYGEFSDEKLSKFDHDEFESEDYKKLHELLGDAHSIMGKRPLHRLYDISESRDLTIKFKGVEVDAVSGATRKEIKNEIVDGALYSCHKLWRIAYGDAVSKIEENMAAIYSDELADHFLKSGHQKYHMLALRNLSADQMEGKLESIVNVLKGANGVVRSYILKKLPKHLFTEPVMAAEIFNSFSSYDNNSKTLIVSNVEHASADEAVALASQIPVMSKNQLKIFLKTIENTAPLRSDELLSVLKDPTISEECVYYYMVASYLKENG